MATHTSILGNPMDRGAWEVVVHGIEKSWTRQTMHAEGRATIHLMRPQQK